MGRPSHDPSIEHEAHLLDAAGFAASAAEPNPGISDEPALGASVSPSATDIDHTVWDEPSLAPSEADGAASPDRLTYARWLDERTAAFPLGRSLAVTLLIVAAAGPWGVIGAFAAGSGWQLGFLGALAAAVVAPLVEEITKVSATLWAVEKRPYWFKSGAQILVCAAAGGLVFAVIENLIYLNVYHPSGGEAFRLWRWTVCTTLHVGCSSLAGVGLRRIWRDTMARRRRPELAVGMPWFAAAMVIHGLYNFAATVAEAGGWLTFD